MKEGKEMKIKSILCSLVVVSSGTLLADMHIDQAVELTMQNNKDIISKKYNNQAYEKYMDERDGAYYPKLDLTANLGAKKTDQELDNGDKYKGDTSGGNVQLDLEQLIYDKKVLSQMESAKYKYSTNKFKNQNDIETVLLNTIDSFLNIAKFQQRIEETNSFLATLDKNYKIAKDTEKINKEVLDKVQTRAKIISSTNKLISEKNNENIAKSYFLKNSGVKAEGKFFEPDSTQFNLPQFNTLQEMALKSNYKILSQIERIKEKREHISEEEGGFLPTLKLKLQASYDKDLIRDDAKTKNYSARLEFKYNIFNGFINQARTERERAFLQEAQAELDVVTDETINDLKTAYMTYKTSSNQLKELKALIEENQKIVNIYQDQFKTGVRSFIDLLNVQSDLYNSKIELINTRKVFLISYYKVLKSLSALQTTFENDDKLTLHQ